MSRNATKAPIALPRFAGSTLFKASTPRAGKTSAQPSPVTNAPASATISLSAPHTIIWPIASVTSDQKATRLPPILSGRLPSATPPMQSTVAMKRFQVAAKISITAADALYNWGNVLFDLSLAVRDGAPEVMTRSAEQLLRRAIAKYREAIAKDPSFADAHNNLANALTDLARAEYPRKDDGMLREAFEHYEKAIRGTETPDVVHCNYAKSLHDL